MLSCHKEMGRHWIGSVNVALQQVNIVHSPKVVHPEFVTRLTRRVPLVEQQLLTHPEHLSSPSVFSRVRVTRSLVLCVCFVHCNLLFVLFLLVIVLSVLRFTDSDYPFGIFKLFFPITTMFFAGSRLTEDVL